jgi:hypothetical protein
MQLSFEEKTERGMGNTDHINTPRLMLTLSVARQNMPADFPMRGSTQLQANPAA